MQGADNAWNWQCWETFPKADSKWVGFFEDEKVAFAWMKDQKGRTFVLNNVAPPRPVPTAPSPFKSTEGYKANKSSPFGTGTSTPRSTAPAAPRKKTAGPVTAEVQAMKGAAKKRLKKHEADEAKELADTDA